MHIVLSLPYGMNEDDFVTTACMLYAVISDPHQVCFW